MIKEDAILTQKISELWTFVTAVKQSTVENTLKIKDVTARVDSCENELSNHKLQLVHLKETKLDIKNF
jgi:hypothetical protein